MHYRVVPRRQETALIPFVCGAYYRTLMPVHPMKAAGVGFLAGLADAYLNKRGWLRL
ncbi:MAG TPA: hypothetical protein VNC62_05430 [Burkholderiales bacterium]|nr:hypothetical protein [Burkholderiales bacterium]